VSRDYDTTSSCGLLLIDAIFDADPLTFRLGLENIGVLVFADAANEDD
jgi:hypothetical protein